MGHCTTHGAQTRRAHTNTQTRTAQQQQHATTDVYTPTRPQLANVINRARNCLSNAVRPNAKPGAPTPPRFPSIVDAHACMEIISCAPVRISKYI